MRLHVPTVLTEHALPFDSPGMKSMLIFIDQFVKNCIRRWGCNTQMLAFVSMYRLSNLKLEDPITAAKRAAFVFLHVHCKHNHDSGLAMCYMPLVYLSIFSPLSRQLLTTNCMVGCLVRHHLTRKLPTHCNGRELQVTVAGIVATGCLKLLMFCCTVHVCSVCI